MSKILDLRLAKRHDAQARVATEASRFNVLVCGRRWGKTTFGLDVLVTEPRGALDGYPVGWFAPTSKVFEEAWQEAKSMLRPVTKRVDSQQHVIELITGGRVDFWTLHNTDDPGRSRKYARVVVDEAALVPSGRLSRQWQESIRPTLTDYAGEAWFTSTPKGAGFFQELYERGAAREPGWMAWQMPTTANPFIDPQEVEEARRDLPSAVFRQEYMAEFVTDFGAIFREAKHYDPQELPRDGYWEATGCDFAYTSKAGDWTVFITGRLGEDGGPIYITDMYRAQAEASDWTARLKASPRPFAFIGGQEKTIAGFLQRDYGINLATEPATADKLARAMPAVAAWNRGEIRLPNGAAITTDIEAECMSFTGNPREDEHDDIVDAIAALHHRLSRVTTGSYGENRTRTRSSRGGWR